MGEELVRRAEEEVALELAEDPQVAVPVEHLPLRRETAGLGGDLVQVELSADDRAPDLVPEEQQDRQGDPDAGGGDEVHADRDDDDRRDDGEIEPPVRVAPAGGTCALSNIRQAMTSRMPARAPMGTQAICGLRRSRARTTNTPSNIPARQVFPPLVTLTMDGPMAPEPGMPPTRKEARFPTPWPTSSRLELERWRVSGVEPHAALQRVDGQQDREGQGGEQDEVEGRRG